VRPEDVAAYLAAIVESSDDAILSKDVNGIIQSCNTAAERLFGYRSDELVGQSVLILIPRERRGEEDQILSRLRRGERIEHFETVRQTKDGRRIDVALTVSPVRDASGNLIGASKIARDITDRRRAHLKAAELAAIVESADDAIISKDLNGIIRSFNSSAERLFGYTAAEIIGKSVITLIPPDRHHEEERILASLRSGQPLDHYETVRVTKDGRRIEVSLTVSPIRSPSGEVVGASKIVRDISERKRAAAEREQLLQSERAARQEAERANRVKDDFVAMVSHELRTPLNAILGWTDLLKGRDGDPEMLAQGIEVIARNTRLQAQLIADLLDVSRIVSGKLSLELSRVDLNEVVRNSVEALQSPALQKGLNLAVRIDPDPIPTIGDPARLQQIVWNLLSNAVKFTPRGGKVTVDLHQRDGFAEIRVTDTGIGIRSEFLPDLFERFRQASSLTTRRHGGLGLGLSIAKHLTDLHGGSIEARSAGEGTGATFTVQLPLRPVEPAADLASRLQESHDADTRAGEISLRGLTILVVEDDQDTRDLIQRLLEAHRAKVVVAASALEALDRLVAERPDIVLSDIGLPDVDGYELIRRIRRPASQFSTIPAIALTAFARFEDRTRALGAGFNAHVAKPVEPAELVITVGSFANLIHASRKP
jgi:PAS domain S-box-containing protein